MTIGSTVTRWERAMNRTDWLMVIGIVAVLLITLYLGHWGY